MCDRTDYIDPRTSGAASDKKVLVRQEVLFLDGWRMVEPTSDIDKGSWFVMAGKSPRGGSDKKEAKLSIKDKRAQKREKTEETGFLKPRKGAAK